MDLSSLLPPANRTCFVPFSSQSVCVKVLHSYGILAKNHHKNFLSEHTRFSAHLNPFFIQPLKPPSLSFQIYAATLKGDMVANKSSTETLKSKVGEVYQISEAENHKVDQSIEVSKNSRKQWVGRKYGPREDKDITVPLDVLKPGAILTGKVTNIKSFGAFVDVGAFSSGMIHISNLSNTYVTSVEDIVKVGDEVQVKVLFVDVPAKRISFKLIKEDEELNREKPLPSLNSFQQHHKASTIQIPHKSSQNAGRPQKGEVLTGSIAKIVQRGVFVTLKQGHEGFLPASEVLSSGQSVETTSYFNVGQQLPVRVSRTTRDRIILTMRKQGNTDNRKETVVIGSEEGRATSPFEIAFRRNESIAKFLEEKERLCKFSQGNDKDSSVTGSATEIHQS